MTGLRNQIISLEKLFNRENLLEKFNNALLALRTASTYADRAYILYEIGYTMFPQS